MRFSKGPHVHFEIKTVKGAILESRLTLSDQFTCSGAAPRLLDWIEAYIQGKHLPLPLIEGTGFQDKVLQALQQIPFGQTLSYSQVAALCGSPKAARAVGNACSRNLFLLFIPCHRVIQANGDLGGFAIDLEIKRRLLEFERLYRE
jgi:O-6-methylguanine DNA methyltransferase